jgi:phage gp36-like protein
MAYCTYSDLAKKIPDNILVSLSNDTSGATSANMSVINEAIETADNEIDSYVALVAAVPVSPTPPLLNDLSAKMAIWNLHLRKYFDSPMWKETYLTCQKILLRIGEGRLVLNDSTADVTDPSGYATATRTQMFTQERWDTF